MSGRTGSAEPPRTEDEYEALADAFERGEFSPVGEVWIAPDAVERVDRAEAVSLDAETRNRLRRFVESTGRMTDDVVRAAVEEYLSAHGA